MANKFEKVSFERYCMDVLNLDMSDATSQLSPEEFAAILEEYRNIKLPVRATKHSAGHDFFSPVDIVLEAGQSIKLPTGIRVQIEDGWFLGILPRSGLGFKYKLNLVNTFAVIDGDFFYSDNEGHIFLKMINDNRENKTLTIKAGDGIAQGIFLPYGITVDDDVNTERNGGFGSTNKGN